METHGVRIERIGALRGPNLYAFIPVLRVTLDVGPYDNRASTEFSGFVDRLVSWLPGLQKHECNIGRPGGFIERLHQGTHLPHICEHIALELQNLLGFSVGFGRAFSTDRPGVYTVIVAFQEEIPAVAAFEAALRLSLAAMHDEPFTLEAELEALRAIADRYRLGPSTVAIVDAARARGIPVLRLTADDSLVQLGYGINQQRLRASMTASTSALAVDVCQEKTVTNELLRTVGVPVPEGQHVHSADEAWAVAREIGLPVVVKPSDGNQGKGVSVDLRTEAEVRAGYEVARRFDRTVMVERYVAGQDYCVLVVNGKMVAAARREPPQVTGDGRRTVAELVDEINRDPRRRDDHGGILSRIALDDAADLVLGHQGLARASVPAPGQVVCLRHNANLSTGGTATDVTDDVHPQNRREAEMAAQILGLDIAGIDILCQDIGRPIREQGGAIVEVNASPDLRMHLYPAAGPPRDVGAPIVDMLFPNGAPSRIPIVAITGTNGKTTTTRLIAFMYETAHKVVGMTSTEGTYIGGARIIRGDCSGPRSARAVLLHPRVEVAVLETARGGILREGLAFDACDVAVVMNVTSDHLGLGGIHTLEELAAVKQVIVAAVGKHQSAVLNADDPLVAEMAAATEGRVVYFSQRPGNPIVQAHLASGGRCVLSDGQAIILAEGSERTDLVEFSRVGFTHGGRIRFQVENALAAVAAAWSVGLNPAIIVRALSTFKTDAQTVPGRFNVTLLNEVEVLLDYGHNPAALAALGQAVQSLGRRHTVMAIALPGDRRDEDLMASIDATRSYVDEYVFYDLEGLRGRASGEVPRMMQARLDGSAPSEIVGTEEQALHRAWTRVGPSGRLILIVDHVDESLALVRDLDESPAGDALCTSPITSDSANVAPAL
jgi:cyanophycin synthetase